jgi:hypothetical protein
MSDKQEDIDFFVKPEQDLASALFFYVRKG